MFTFFWRDMYNYTSSFLIAAEYSIVQFTSLQMMYI